ncbi:hypothetical protein NN561_012006 [Cricetulus griseus]
MTQRRANSPAWLRLRGPSRLGGGVTWNRSLSLSLRRENTPTPGRPAVAAPGLQARGRQALQPGSQRGGAANFRSSRDGRDLTLESRGLGSQGRERRSPKPPTVPATLSLGHHIVGPAHPTRGRPRGSGWPPRPWCSPRARGRWCTPGTAALATPVRPGQWRARRPRLQPGDQVPAGTGLGDRGEPRQAAWPAGVTRGAELAGLGAHQGAAPGGEWDLAPFRRLQLVALRPWSSRPPVPNATLNNPRSSHTEPRERPRRAGTARCGHDPAKADRAPSQRRAMGTRAGRPPHPPQPRAPVWRGPRHLHPGPRTSSTRTSLSMVSRPACLSRGRGYKSSLASVSPERPQTRAPHDAHTRHLGGPEWSASPRPARVCGGRAGAPSHVIGRRWPLPAPPGDPGGPDLY